MKTDEFVKQINSLRLQNKNKWYTYQGTVNNKTVALKGYGTWLQILRVDGFDLSNRASTGYFRH